MKIGDYVRTKYDGIQKIVKVTENNCFYRTCTAGFDYHTSLNDDDIVQLSTDILDLIYPGDLLYIDICPDDCGGIVVPRTTETQNEVDEYKERIRSGKYILKGILTREQIKDNYYWIEGDSDE